MQQKMCLHPNTVWMHCRLVIVSSLNLTGEEMRIQQCECLAETIILFVSAIFTLKDVSNFMLRLVMVRGEIITDEGHLHNQEQF